nr:MAG TPA: hypothetical protein [Caudoviricetes sp.]
MVQPFLVSPFCVDVSIYVRIEANIKNCTPLGFL